MNQPETAILHYTAPPIVGGVEAVIQAHVVAFVRAGYPVTVIAGRGEENALPPEAELTIIPEVDSQHELVTKMSAQLEEGKVPAEFDDFVDRLTDSLRPVLDRFSNVIVHNIFSKHFNLPLTAALYRLLDAGDIYNCIAWGHDFTWTSSNSRSKVYQGYPWDLLRTWRDDITYVVVSQHRQQELAKLYDRPAKDIQVIYNGVDPQTLLGLSEEGYALVERLKLLENDLILLMPVRVTQAKNIEFALKTIAALKDQGVRPALVQTGPPDPHDAASMAYFESLRTMREQLGVKDEVHFVFESGPDPDEPYLIDQRVVGDLFRVSDLMFMPSHREGFGMPVLEAGLAGMPVFSTPVPAAKEIGNPDVEIFDASQDPKNIAVQILDWTESSIHGLRRRVRQDYTWSAIFERQIEPLLQRKAE
jgi:glycosyltransferase involved in cell wall biosynthesis